MKFVELTLENRLNGDTKILHRRRIDENSLPIVSSIYISPEIGKNYVDLLARASISSESRVDRSQ